MEGSLPGGNGKNEIEEFHYEAGMGDMCPKKRKQWQNVPLKIAQVSSRHAQ